MKSYDKNSSNSQIICNALSSAILSGISFFTIPIFTRILGAEQYGLYGIFCTWSALLIPIISLEVNSSIGIAKYDFSNKYSEYKKNCLLIGTIVFILFLVVTIVFNDQLSSFLGFSKDVVLILVVYSFFSFVIELTKSIYTFEKKAHLNLILSISLALITSILSFLLIKNNTFYEQYKGRVYGVSLPYILIGILLWLNIYKKNKGTFNIYFCKYAISYGFPIVFHMLSHDVLGQSDRLMLKYMGYDGSVLGIYCFFQTFTSVLSILLISLNNSWVPFYYDDLKRKNMSILSNKVKNYIELFTILTIGFLMLSREVCYIFANEQYWGGMNIIPFYVISIYFMFMYQFPVNFEYYNKKTKIISIGTVFAGLINVILNYITIPKFGMYGASFSTMTSYGLLYIAHSIIANNVTEMKYHISIKDQLPGLLMVILSVILFLTLKNFWIIRWSVGLAIGVYEIRKIVKRKSIF